MKENLLEELATILLDLQDNEIQSIEVRGAIAFGIQFQNALAVIPEGELVALEPEEEEVIVETKTKK